MSTDPNLPLQGEELDEACDALVWSMGRAPVTGEALEGVYDHAKALVDAYGAKGAVALVRETRRRVQMSGIVQIAEVIAADDGKNPFNVFHTIAALASAHKVADDNLGHLHEMLGGWLDCSAA